MVLGPLAGLARPAPAEAAGGFAVDLYRPGDFVAQTNLVQCVGASMQMMINMMAPGNDRTASTQRRFWLLARSYSSHQTPNPRRRGASVRGWALGLNELGYGPYRVIGFPTLREATRVAARAMRVTGKPVGLLVWAGRHAWVMSGFRATADPLVTDSFRVTHVDVLDPLYPLGSARWGASPRPGSRLTTAVLGEDFVRRRRINAPGRPPSALARKYVVVLPVTESSTGWQPRAFVE